MSMSNAERQRRYRERRLASGDERLTIMVDRGTRRALRRLTRWHQLTLQQALALAVARTEAALTDSLPAQQRLEYLFSDSPPGNATPKPKPHPA
jgi:hypothetical protein